MNEKIIKILTLTTTHNRVNMTINSLSSLRNQKTLKNVKFEHHIVDDKSIDGTPNYVSKYFPYINIHNGDGSLYWAGGMRFGYELIKKIEYDFLFIYNDDCRFLTNAIQKMLDSYYLVKSKENSDVVIVGCLVSESTGNPTYGGRNRYSVLFPLSSRLAQLSDKPQKVDTLNMNAALIPKSITDKIGFLAKYFHHGGADWEYGMRLTKNGYGIYQTEGFIGFCEGNSLIGTSKQNDLTCLERMKRKCSIKEMPIHTRYKFSREYCGYLWVLSFLSPYIAILIHCFTDKIKKWLQKIYFSK